MDKSLLSVAHETIQDLHTAGVVYKVTMRHFDALCLPVVQNLSSEDIKTLRAREKISQPILARALNVSPSTVKHWEIGDKRPSGAALKLLNLIFKKGLAVVV